MRPDTRALVEHLLGGRPYPASHAEIVCELRANGLGDAAGRLSKRKYRSAGEVAEELLPVQPAAPAATRPVPRAESAEPPGGDLYTASRA